MVKQAIANLPDGAVKADAPKIVLPDREKMKTQMESLIHHFKIVTEGFTVPEARYIRALNRHGARWAITCKRWHRKPYRVHMRSHLLPT